MTLDELTFGGPFRIAQLRYSRSEEEILDGSFPCHRESRAPGTDLSDLPNDARKRIEAEWTLEVVAAYREATTEAPEPSPTAEELQALDAAEVERTFTIPSILRALVKDRFDLENRIRALEGKQPVTLTQFKAAFAARIRGNGA